ncbi:unnamed protein product [Prunus armeniaca]|uniref:Uncharacterized protein n=1 Tax=Prunus armeniaca TaxID=36596 RepID=A0A6J5TG94_PRUAR|nr:hypothetical protein GBA52_004797 [Prunus armeniaca]CAB4262227.1 unnamed protein product [Prunus armeniaca]
MPEQAEEPKDHPSMSSQDEEEEEEEKFLSVLGKEWIKIGDEYFPNPVAMPPSEQFINTEEIETEPSVQSGKNMQRKRRFESEKQQENVPELPNEIPNNALLKNHSHKLKDKYVKLQFINRGFMSKTEEMEEEEEEKLASPYSFRTSRRYLYRD